MIKNSLDYFHTSIGRKQIVSVTGMLLIIYVVAHLAGNLLLYLGPATFNGYAKALAGLRPGLYIIEVGLALIFLIHMWVTGQLVWENIQARGQNRYKVYHSQGKRSWAARTMPYTGFLIFTFVVWHLLDFTFVDHEGDLSILSDGKSYGLYGVVYNAFSDPTHSVLYILAMIVLGFHLAHAVQSFAQTFGIQHPKHVICLRRFSLGFGIFIAAAFSSIPIYVLIRNSLT